MRRWTSVVLLFLVGCGAENALRTPAEFQSELSGSVIYSSPRGAQGLLDSTKTGKSRAIKFRLEPPLNILSPLSLVVEYSLRDAPSSGVEFILDLAAPSAGGPSFVLPLVPPETIRYAAPLALGVLEYLSITAGGENLPVLELKSLDIVPRWYGFERDSRGLSLSPFVFTGERGSVSILVPESFAFPADLAIRAGGGIRCVIGDRSFEPPSRTGEFFIPSGFFPAGISPAGEGVSPGALPGVLVEGDGLEAVRLIPAQFRPFPDPIPLDPGMILAYPQSSWRRGDYEIFRWEGFPSLLIFDTADYEVQDRLLKRLAFFVEKAGYRGRLAPDGEIADQHGWNAHDYRARDLARFFEAARLENFPLLPEERELEAILLDAAIIVLDGDRIIAGEGGIVSISRESTGYLRDLFMAHEGFHGIFFIDEDFRAFSRRRWDALSPGAQRFILSYFDYQHYDIQDDYLVVNEFMAHVLQQPVSGAARYFGETLASRIAASPWRSTVLPEKDEATGTWPELAEAFRGEAEAFDAYVSRRWGLGAGRVHRVMVK
jgi:hypothetical protein